MTFENNDGLLGLQQLWPGDKFEQQAILMFVHILPLKPEYLPRGGGIWRGYESGNRISDVTFLTVFHNDYASTLHCLVLPHDVYA